jgi:hypothetical protein
VCLQVWRRDDDVVFRALTPAAFGFRRALADGRALGTAARMAFAIDPHFDLATSLSELLHDDVLVTFTLDREECS